jgi:uncharacterized protein (UPF0335 family)
MSTEGGRCAEIAAEGDVRGVSRQQINNLVERLDQLATENEELKEQIEQ